MENWKTDLPKEEGIYYVTLSNGDVIIDRFTEFGWNHGNSVMAYRIITNAATPEPYVTESGYPIVLAIRGDEDRKDEIVSTLVSLGGQICSAGGYGGVENLYYYIDSTSIGSINCISADSIENNGKWKTYTIEKFNQLYPYKIGDAVIYRTPDNKAQVVKIDLMRVLMGVVYYKIRLQQSDWTWVTVDCLEPVSSSNDILSINFSKKDSNECYYKIPDGLVFDRVTSEGDIVLKRKPVSFPKTYSECCDILGECASESTNTGHMGSEIEALQRLLVCRNAFWKLDNSYYPDWEDSSVKHYIQYSGSDLIMDEVEYGNKVLAFSTPEIRDLFYLYFDDLIEKCRNLI